MLHMDYRVRRLLAMLAAVSAAAFLLLPAATPVYADEVTNTGTTQVTQSVQETAADSAAPLQESVQTADGTQAAGTQSQITSDPSPESSNTSANTVTDSGSITKRDGSSSAVTASDTADQQTSSGTANSSENAAVTESAAQTVSSQSLESQTASTPAVSAGTGSAASGNEASTAGSASASQTPAETQGTAAQTAVSSTAVTTSSAAATSASAASGTGSSTDTEKTQESASTAVTTSGSGQSQATSTQSAASTGTSSAATTGRSSSRTSGGTVIRRGSTATSAASTASTGTSQLTTGRTGSSGTTTSDSGSLRVNTNVVSSWIWKDPTDAEITLTRYTESDYNTEKSVSRKIGTPSVYINGTSKIGRAKNWTCDNFEEGTEGTFIFTAGKIDSRKIESGVEMPQVRVTIVNSEDMPVTVTDWFWNDGDSIEDGEIHFTTTALSKEQVVANLPTSITNDTTGEIIPIESWRVRNYHRGEASKATFTANIPDKYRLGRGTDPLKLTVITEDLAVEENDNQEADLQVGTLEEKTSVSAASNTISASKVQENVDPAADADDDEETASNIFEAVLNRVKRALNLDTDETQIKVEENAAADTQDAATTENTADASKLSAAAQHLSEQGNDAEAGDAPAGEVTGASENDDTDGQQALQTASANDLAAGASSGSQEQMDENTSGTQEDVLAEMQNQLSEANQESESAVDGSNGSVAAQHLKVRRVQNVQTDSEAEGAADDTAEDALEGADSQNADAAADTAAILGESKVAATSGTISNDASNAATEDETLEQSTASGTDSKDSLAEDGEDDGESAEEAEEAENASEEEEDYDLFTSLRSVLANIPVIRKIVPSGSYDVQIPDNDKAYQQGSETLTYVLDPEEIEFHVPTNGKIYAIEFSVDSGEISSIYDQSGAIRTYTMDAGKDYLVMTASDDGLPQETLNDIINGFVFKPEPGAEQKVTITINGNKSNALPEKTNLVRENIRDEGDHYYMYFGNSVSWDKAYNEAKKITFNGMIGYLMTVDSDNDIAALKELNRGNGWMGATAIVDDSLGRISDQKELGTLVLKNTGDQYYWSDGNETGNIPKITISDDNVDRYTKSAFISGSNGNYTYQGAAYSETKGYYVEFSDYQNGHDEAYNSDAIKNGTVIIKPSEITVRYHLNPKDSSTAYGTFADSLSAKGKLNAAKTVLEEVIKDGQNLDSDGGFPKWELDVNYNTTTKDVLADGRVLLYFEDTDGNIYWPDDPDAITAVPGNTLELYAVWADLFDLTSTFKFDTEDEKGNNAGYFNESSADAVINAEAKYITSVQEHKNSDGNINEIYVTVDRSLALKDLPGGAAGTHLAPLANKVFSDAYKDAAIALADATTFDTVGDIVALIPETGATSHPDPHTPLKSGLKFKGWDVGDGSIEALAATMLPSAAVTNTVYSAEYVQDKGQNFKVILHIVPESITDNPKFSINNDGFTTSSESKQEFVKVVNSLEKAFILNDAVCEGYLFKGWNTKDNFSGDDYDVINPADLDGDLVLYGQLDTATYIVRFKPVKEGAKVADGWDVREFNTATSFALPNATCTGYEINGWYSAASYDAESKIGDYGSTFNTKDLPLYDYDGDHEVTFYANWKPYTYGVSYTIANSGTDPLTGTDANLVKYYNDGKVNLEEITFDDMKNYHEGGDAYWLRYPDSDTRDDYIFIGWYSKPAPSADELDNKITKITPQMLADTSGGEDHRKGAEAYAPYKLYAYWQYGKTVDEKTYYIKYVKNGGTWSRSDYTDQEMVKSSDSSVTLYNAVKDEVNAKWYLTPDKSKAEGVLGKPIEKLTPQQVEDYHNEYQGSNYTEDGFKQLTLYADYDGSQEGSFKVIFHPRNGEENYTLTLKYTDSPQNLIEKYLPEMENNLFLGWHRDPLYEDDPVYTLNPAEETGDVNLYAEWYADEITINYHTNGGENSKLNPTVVFADDSRFQLSPATKKDATFQGWFTDPEFKNQITVIDPSTIYDYKLDLYAKWDEKKDASTQSSTSSTASTSSTSASTGSTFAGTRRAAAAGGALISPNASIIGSTTAAGTIVSAIATGGRSVSTGDTGLMPMWGVLWAISSGSLILWILAYQAGRKNRRKAYYRREQGRTLKDMMQDQKKQ